MKTLNDYQKRIKQEQERFDQEILHKKNVFEKTMEKNQTNDDAACQEIRDAFINQSECRSQSFDKRKDSHQVEQRQHLVSQSASLDKKASESDLERFKNRQRLLRDDSH